MITAFEAGRLRQVRAASATVLSVYLWVPLDLAGHRGLATRARELVKSAAGPSRPADSDLEAIVREIALHHQDWIGHTVAIFACRELGLLEAVPLPGQLAERAVIATRPYTVPLLAAAQRNPAYRVAVIDSRHAWILAVTGAGIETVAERTERGVPSQGYGGWYGLEAHRIQQRVMRLSRLHFRDTIAILERSDSMRRDRTSCPPTRMLPPVTTWPPKRLMPSRCPCESRPFVDDPPPFLCAMTTPSRT